MNLQDVRSTIERPWARVAEARERYWRERRATEGSSATFAASWAMSEFQRRMHPGWPGEAERQLDLDAHVRLKSLIDRAAHTFHTHRAQ